MNIEHRTWIWLGILVVAILAHLGLAVVPFTLSEASTSLTALNADATAADSTFLFTGQVLDFALFGASETVARLIPAMTAILLVMLPWFWRDQLGEVGAITLALVLLLSPLTLGASRRVDSTVLSLCAAALLATGVMLKVTSRERSDVILAIGVIMALTGGMLVWDILIAAGLTFAVLRWKNKDNQFDVQHSDYVTPLLIGTLIAVVVMAWMGFYAGWDGLFKGLVDWWHSWQRESLPYGPLSMLFLYEPALFVAGLAAMAAALFPKTRSTGTWSLALFAGVLALLLELRPGIGNFAAAALVLPLAVLVALVVQRWFDTCSRQDRRWVLIYVVLAVIFWIPALIALTQHAGGAIMSVDPGLFMVIGLVVLLALQVLLAILANLVMPVKWIYRSALAGAVVFLLLIQLSYATNLAFVRGASPAEPVVSIGGTEDLHALTSVLDSLAVENTMRRDAMPIVIVDDGTVQSDVWVPLVAWTLRDFDMAEVVPAAPSDFSGYVITAERASVSPGLAGRHGMRFTAAEQMVYPVPVCTSLYPLDCQRLAAWLLYRELARPPVQYGIILWAP